MKKQKKSVDAAVDDRISELPDDIIHRILRRINSYTQAAKTTALSRRWRSLWRSYPAVEFDQMGFHSLQKFAAASVDRLSRNNQLRIQDFKFTVAKEDVAVKILRSPEILQQLVRSAWQRKPEEITININGFVLPFEEGFSISDVKILRLTGITFGSDWRRYCKNNLPPLSSLRLLCFENVKFENNEHLLQNLIANAPFLETLELREIAKVRKLRAISKHTHLKTIKIGYPLDVDEIEIVAPGLETLHLQPLYHDLMIQVEVTAPKLRHLELGGSGFTERNLDEMLSKLGPSLKSLTMLGLDRVQKLEISTTSELEEFKLFMWSNSQLREVKLDAGPCLKNVFLGCRNALPDGKFEKCEISGAAKTCRLEADFGHVRLDSTRFVIGLRRFIAGFSQVRTVNISFLHSPQVSLDWETLLERDTHPIAILHLKLGMNVLSSRDQRAVLDCLFWACRPKFLTVIPKTSELKTFFRTLLSLMSQHYSYKYQHELYRLKDVKIVTRDIDDPSIKIEEEELMDVPKYVDRLLVMQRQICFMLTWH